MSPLRIPGPYFVFHAAAPSKYGVAFAVGWSVVDDVGAEKDAGLLWIHPRLPDGVAKERIVPAIAETVPEPTHTNYAQLRTAFWARLRFWAREGAGLWAGALYPMAATFLWHTVLDDRSRTDEVPPLHDVATAARIGGFDDPTGVPRLPAEEPRWNPLADARLSSRILVAALSTVS